MIASAATGGGTKTRLASAPDLAHGLAHRVEDGAVEHRLAAPARRDAAHDVGAVADHVGRVELADAARHALDDDAGRCCR